MRPARTSTAEEARALDLGALAHSPGFLLRLAQTEVFEQFYATLGQFGLRPGEFSVLYAIHLNPGLRPGALAERLRIKPARLTKLLRAFEEQGFVTRSVVPGDRRAVELRLTAEGTRFVTDHACAFTTLSRSQASRLLREEADELVRLLRRFTGLEETP